MTDTTETRAPLDLPGLVASLRAWAEQIERRPQDLVAFYVRVAFRDEKPRSILVEGAGGGAVSLFDENEDDEDDETCGLCVDPACTDCRPATPRRLH